MHEIVVESEGKRTFIDQTDPAIACTRCCTCRGEEERSNGIAIVRANGGAPIVGKEGGGERKWRKLGQVGEARRRRPPWEIRTRRD